MAAILAHQLAAAAAEASPGQTELKAGELTAILGDNSAAGEHRSGYNGIWSLRHAACSRDLFVPSIAGLNLEHIITGEHLDDDKLFFEPRNSPMALTRLSETEAELHQPPTSASRVESWTRFQLVAPHYIDMQFRCVAHEPVFTRGYLAFFWASYINAPLDKSLYFLGGLPGQKNQWSQLCPQWHNDQSTVRHRDDQFDMSFPEGGRDALFKNLSRLRFDEPFYYGHFDEMIWILMFDRSSGIRITQSPSGGGFSAQFNTTNPAWDFQFLIEKPEVKKEYSFRTRAVFRRRCHRDEIVEEFKRWKAE
jgi:hypothetical protein